MSIVESTIDTIALLKRTYKIKMPKSMYMLLLLGIFYSTTYSQVLSGVIRSSNGEPIPFASIYIRELTTGTTSNLDGEYSIELAPGISHVSFQALSFTKVQREVNMLGEDMVMDIELRPQNYEIKEVRVFSGDEDPAYGIIRNSISLAPYFLRQIKHYKANVYLKGGFDMNKVPRLFRKQLKEEGIEEGNSYVAESVNEITFNSPNRYIHKQISKRSTIPNDGDDEVLGFLNYSFYDSESELAISPISRKALSFYKYRYEGFFQQGEHYVNKIKVTPKRKNQKLFEGYIYVVDKLWNLHSVDLVNEQFFGKVRIKQVQEQVKGKAWLPVSHHFDVDLNMMGFKVVANYGGSVKYEKVELNTDLPVPSSLKKAYAEVEAEQEFLKEKEQTIPPLTKNQEKVEALLKKDDLSNREMMKLSRLMEKENRGMEQVGKGLRLESRDSLYRIVKDTVSVDSIDWNKIRPIPLSKKEIESFGIKDSLTLALAGLEVDTTLQEKKKRSKLAKTLGNILYGMNSMICDSTVEFGYNGLIGLGSFGFNSVDGVSYAQQFDFRRKFADDRRRIDIIPTLKYAFGRQKLMWNLETKLHYDHIKRIMFTLNAGQISKDFNEETGIAPFVNMASSLLLKDNYMKLYQDNYIYVRSRTVLFNGLDLSVKVKYQNIDRLENNTDYSFAYNNKDYRENNRVLNHEDVNVFMGRKSFFVEGKLTYTPKYFYKIEGGKKTMLHSDYPTFNLLYRSGLSGVLNATARYDLLELSVDQELQWSLMYHLNYDISAGYFLNNSAMHFSHFKHFNTSEVPISFKDWKRNFNLLNDYEYSTNKWYVEAHLSYSTPYLLIKNIPFLQDKLWNENIYFSHLTQSGFKNYNEVGYGISQIYLVANVGVFAGFNEMEFERWGVRLSINLGQ
ncbi:DUF5686 family protein [Saccharicrinis sp. GN24d3]|uniref:DUF5686 family protein n=1 Tax=Saccharicrinis sp. GN24d3 TaxID=3458416 RepID=UPI0040354477